VPQDENLVTPEFRETKSFSARVAKFDFKNIRCQHLDNGPDLAGRKTQLRLVLKQGNDIKHFGRLSLHGEFIARSRRPNEGILLWGE